MTADVTWLVGRAEEIGQLQQRLGPVEATIEETWPASVGAGVVALVRSAADDVDTVAEALGSESRRFDAEDDARRAAADAAGSS